MPTWVIPLLRPPSLKKTMSPGRSFDLVTFLDGRCFHWPRSLMGSLWPNLAKTLLVRHVQLISLLVQVPYLYLVPMYLFAALTTPLPEARPLAVTSGSLRSAAVGGVSSTSEGSLGPALPSVNEPCEGAPSEGETFACGTSDAGASESGPGVVLSCAVSSVAYCCEDVCASTEMVTKETRNPANTNADRMIVSRRTLPPSEKT